MSNKIKNVRADLWTQPFFRKLCANERIFYFFIHTSEETSETSAFLLPISLIEYSLEISKTEIYAILKKFKKLNIIEYDRRTEEIVVLDMFDMKVSANGLYYEMYAKDLKKIKSSRLKKALLENAKKHEICMALFAAIQDIFPEINEEEFKIVPTKMTPDDARNAGKKGRNHAKKPKDDNIMIDKVKDDDIDYDSGEELF